MPKTTKPILQNGFKIDAINEIKNRLENIFFTEVYSLTNDKYFYLFLNLKPDEYLDRGKKYNVITVKKDEEKYLGLIVDEHNHSILTKAIDELTVLRGFDCIAGMKPLKALLIDDVIKPLLNPEKFKKFKLSIPNGILFYGPPGCGKTFIVKKLAEEIGYHYFELSPSSVSTSYVHGAVGNIGKVFEIAKQNAPSIIFIDEIEGLVPKREDLSSSADIKKEEINEFLLQLNNAGENRILVIGATNRPHMIDSAILRSGRMDKRIYIPVPDFEARRDMFKLCLSGRPHDHSINFGKLAKMTENYVSSDINLIVTQAARQAVAQERDIIDEELLVDSINKIRPSITLEEINSYEQFGSMERW